MRFSKAAGSARAAGVVSKATFKTFSSPVFNLSLTLLALSALAALLPAPCARFTTAYAQTGPTYGVYTPPAGFQTFDAGEPSIGVNWKTGSVFFQSRLQTMRGRFDDTASPARATWADVSAPTTSVVSLDPILYTDGRTGRVFSSQLAGATSLMA